MSMVKMLDRHLHKKQYIQAMTLLEVLIAIFVMGIGIIAITKLMTYNIQTISRVHKQTIATSLAREWLEMVSNVRDTNTLLWYERNCAIRSTKQEISQITQEQSLCKSYFWSGDSTEYNYIIDGWLQADHTQIMMKRITSNNLWEEGKLSMTGIFIWWTTISGYIHSNTEKENPTFQFSRYITFSGLSSLPTDSPLSSSDINSVRSIVLYNNGTNTGEIILESFIANKE